MARPRFKDDDLVVLPFPSEQMQKIAAAMKHAKGLYAAPPGSGPDGETCGSCKHIARSAKFRKCELVRHKWTHGLGTDIKARAPACSKWEAA